MNKEQAKEILDKFLAKQRVSWYKPIQVAEILYRKRIAPESIDLLNLETYRTQSKKWRDEISRELVGSVSTSSAKFQDDLFNTNAIPPEVLNVLGIENIRTNGAVEAYIYNKFFERRSQLITALSYVNKHSKESFSLHEFINLFWLEPGLKRSLDKIYEIVVYALFSTLTYELGVQVELSVSDDKIDLLNEFSDFAKSVMLLDPSSMIHAEEARIYRVGVTNAADRGLDMYANWGPAIQVKHLALDEELAKSVVNSISSDRIVIVCKSAEQGIIVSLLTQIGWKSKIQSVITEDNLIEWYEKALRGQFSNQLGNYLLDSLRGGILEEFPQLEENNSALLERHYENIVDTYWK